MIYIILAIILIILIVLIANLKIVPQAQEYVVERLGSYKATWQTGVHFKIPFIERIAKKVSLKENVVDFPPQPVITKDNVTMQIDTVVFYLVSDPKLFTYGIDRPIAAIENLTATTLRNIIGDLDLDATLTSRDVINTKITAILDEASDKWGIKVTRVELKNIMPPREIQEAMEKQMKAERERRESILQAEGRKKSQILVAEGEKQSQILKAEAEKETAILLAEAEKEKQIREAEGQAPGDHDGPEGQRRRAEAAVGSRPVYEGPDPQELRGPDRSRQRPLHQDHHPERDPEPRRPRHLPQRGRRGRCPREEITVITCKIPGSLSRGFFAHFCSSRRPLSSVPASFKSHISIRQAINRSVIPRSCRVRMSPTSFAIGKMRFCLFSSMRIQGS